MGCNKCHHCSKVISSHNHIHNNLVFVLTEVYSLMLILGKFDVSHWALVEQMLIKYRQNDIQRHELKHIFLVCGIYLVLKLGCSLWTWSQISWNIFVHPISLIINVYGRCCHGFFGKDSLLFQSQSCKLQPRVWQKLWYAVLLF